MSRFLKIFALAFGLIFLLPIAISAVLYWLGDKGLDWQSADRSSTGLLLPAAEHAPAAIRVFAARTVRWRGIFATHCWIVIKDEGGNYDRYDYTAWGEPIRLNGFAPDGRWFGRAPDLVFAADGAAAALAVPKIRAAIAAYTYSHYGDYRAWPGPNSNTFVQALLDAAPELGATLPSTAIGKDFPYDGRWIALTPTGIRLRLAGYGGLALGWREGLEINFMGGVAGFDFRRPAIKLPGIGRLGLSAATD